MASEHGGPTRSIQVGERFRSNYGPLKVYEKASLADRYRIVGLIAEQGKWAGARFGVPEHELGTRFSKLGTDNG